MHELQIVIGRLDFWYPFIILIILLDIAWRLANSLNNQMKFFLKQSVLRAKWTLYSGLIYDRDCAFKNSIFLN